MKIVAHFNKDLHQIEPHWTTENALIPKNWIK